MSAGIELRPLPEPSSEQEATPESRPPSYGRTAVVLGVALALVLGAWVTSEVQQGRRVRTLQAHIESLEAQIAERDRAISAQAQRIEDVRDHVEALRELLDMPLHGAR